MADSLEEVAQVLGGLIDAVQADTFRSVLPSPKASIATPPKSQQQEACERFVSKLAPDDRPVFARLIEKMCPR